MALSSSASGVSIETLDSRMWPIDYALSRLRMQASQELSRLSGVPAETIYTMIEVPKKEEHGHFSLPIPKLRLPENPTAVAAKFAAEFKKDDVFVQTSSIGPFFNVSVNPRHLLNETMREALSLRERYGTNTLGAGRRIAVEYSSPNIAKPFHAGHLRSTIIGNFLRNVYKACGFDVVGINYLGDWGKQYGLLAVGFKKYGSEEELQRDPIRHLFDVYVKINQDLEADPTVDDAARVYFKQMEEGNVEALTLWRRFRDLSIDRYKQTYARLNIEFDEYSGESFFEEKMLDTIKELKERELLVDSKGAQVVDLNAFGLGSPLVIKSDGATLYLTRDLAAADDRFKRLNIEKSIYVVAMQQDLHLAQLFKIMDLLGRPFAKNMLHVNFGMVKGMKTRKGQVIFLNDILDEAQEVMHSVMRQNEAKYAEVQDPEGTSDILAVSAVVIQDMAAKRIKDYDFKIERVTNFEGDTGPYLQFAHSRLCSIERKSGLVLSGNEDLSLLVEKEALDLATFIARFPDIVQEARITTEPCTMVSYLMALSRVISTTLDHLWVMGQEEPVAKARLALYVAARYTLGNGLCILGLKPLERM